MKRILLVLLIAATPFTLTGCSIYDFFGSPVDDENFPAEIDRVIYDTDQIEETSAEALSVENLIDDALETEEVADVEEETTEDKTETDLEQVFTGNWSLYMEFGEFRTEGVMKMLGGEATGQEYAGAMTAVSGLVHDDTDDSISATTPSGERVTIDVDNNIIDITAIDTSLTGTLTTSDNTASATGTFTSALGDGTWYMVNTQPATWPEF